MDSSERYQKTARTARLGILLIGNLAALFFLLNQFGGESDARVLDAGSADLAVVAPSVGSSPGLSPKLLTPEPIDPVVKEDSHLDRSLGNAIELHITAALLKAKKLTKGKASTANCKVAITVLNPLGEEIVGRSSLVALRPASNMKLVTTAAALLRLGPDGAFETRFESTGTVTDGVLQGDLVVRAGGDPFFDGSTNGQVEHLLAPLMADLKALGIRSIAGDLVLDQGTFADPGPAPGWPASNQYWQEHCALAAGFNANAGCLTAVVRPSSVGATAPSELLPHLGGLKRSGSVKTVSAKSRLNIAVGATTSKATLRGSIPTSTAQWVGRFSHPDPVGLFGEVLKQALGNAGIKVTGEVRRSRQIPTQRVLAVLRTPIASHMQSINADSNNCVADQLFFALGDQSESLGTRGGGWSAVKKALNEIGVSSEGLVQVDGSGLSRDNRVAPRQLARLLYEVARSSGPVADMFMGSLAVAGRRGSLANRMKGTPASGHVFAKTGWIQGTSALSGYVETTAGELLCFSILVEYPALGGLNTSCWKPMGDAICVELARWKSVDRRVR